MAARRSSLSEPVTVQRVRALITEPSPQAVHPGELAISGVAWSGAAPIARRRERQRRRLAGSAPVSERNR